MKKTTAIGIITEEEFQELFEMYYPDQEPLTREEIMLVVEDVEDFFEESPELSETISFAFDRIMEERPQKWVEGFKYLEEKFQTGPPGIFDISMSREGEIIRASIRDSLGIAWVFRLHSSPELYVKHTDPDDPGNGYSVLSFTDAIHKLIELGYLE